MHGRSNGHVLIAATGLTLALVSFAARAHPAHVQRGEMTLREGGVTVRFPIDAQDAVHHGTTVDEVSHDLSSSFYMFDEFGRRVMPVSVMTDAAGCTIRFDISGDQQFATFQQRIESPQIARNRLMQLDVTRADEQKLPSLQLSAGGNAETIDLRPQGDEHNKWDRVDRFHELLLVITTVDDGTALELHVPAALLETWLPLRRACADAIEQRELEQCADSIRNWFAAGLAAESAGEAIPMQITRIVLLGPACDDLSELSPPSRNTSDGRSQPTEAVGYWCARIAIEATLSVEKSTLSNLELRCGLFNSRVLTMKAVVQTPAEPTWHTFSTYEPRVRVFDAGEPVEDK